MTKNIILNWLPPAMVECPSPAMTALKTFVENEGFNAPILYWNLKLHQMQKDFLWGHSTSSDHPLWANIVFLNYLAIKFKDENAFVKIKTTLIGLKPSYLNVSSEYYDSHMRHYAQLLEELIKSELQKINIEDVVCFGLSVNLYQWIGSSIIASIFKELYPHIPIVIGGIGSKSSACEFLKEFPQYDFAIWGEGEYSLLKLALTLTNKEPYSSFSNIPHILYRNGSEIISSQYTGTTPYIDLNSPDLLPNFQDYFSQVTNGIKPYIPIEGSRGCHWKQCRFCYLNTGYKHRVKSADVICNQILELISKHHIYDYCFLDNDVISNDWKRFSDLLDGLIKIKEDYPSFRIILAEIITKHITSDYIRKMSLAGFYHVQIGYESTSDNLLRKINKKNTFASNILFLKFATKYGILVSGANIIRGLLEETYEDVLEAIVNLRYLRFYFSLGKFKHHISSLGIMKTSRYFEEAKNNSNFRLYSFAEYLPLSFLSKNGFEDGNIVEKVSLINKDTWQNFESVENFFIKANYSYKLFYCNNREDFVYKEFFNNEVVNEILIEKKSLDYLILEESDKEVLTMDRLNEKIRNHDAYNGMTDCEVLNTIDELMREGLIYANSDFSEIVSLIDLECII